ncbi:MAG: ROK family protein, partial [Planctomycetes bacterium]|nr:ROK family protein [Planctomycetota bacterium]
GGPVFGAKGIVQTSHQVPGWDDFPIVEWTQAQLGLPTTLGNDCDVAALAESCFGAGRNSSSLFYVTVGTGIGGGLVIDRKIHGTDRPASAEIGHLRPGLDFVTSKQTIESQAAGPGIAQSTRKRIEELKNRNDQSPDIQELMGRCGGELSRLETKDIGIAAAAGNQLARSEFAKAARVLGWGLAQVTTLIAPEVLVVGGGVSLVPEDIFIGPLRVAVEQFVFPPLKGSYRLLPAALGESVVVHGALALARHTK